MILITLELIHINLNLLPSLIRSVLYYTVCGDAVEKKLIKLIKDQGDGSIEGPSNRQ